MHHLSHLKNRRTGSQPKCTRKKCILEMQLSLAIFCKAAAEPTEPVRDSLPSMLVCANSSCRAARPLLSTTQNFWVFCNTSLSSIHSTCFFILQIPTDCKHVLTCFSKQREKAAPAFDLCYLFSFIKSNT